MLTDKLDSPSHTHLSSANVALQPPCLINLLSDDDLIHIFSYLQHLRDYNSASLANRKFYQISRSIPKFRHPHGHMVPSFFSADPAMRRLSMSEQLHLVKKMEDLMCSQTSLRSVFCRESKGEGVWGPARAIMGNYCAFAPNLAQSVGSVEVVNLSTGQSSTLKAHPSNVDLCKMIDGPTPLLATGSSEERTLKIWEIEKLFASPSPEPILERKANSPFSQSRVVDGQYVYPFFAVARVNGCRIALGFTDHVLILDCSCLSTQGTIITVPNVIQIEFSDAYILLVTKEKGFIWNLNLIKQNAILSPETASRSFTVAPEEPEEDCIRIAWMNQNRVVFAYEKCRDLSVGEVHDICSGEKIRDLKYPGRPGYRGYCVLSSAEFRQSIMFSASQNACKWLWAPEKWQRKDTFLDISMDLWENFLSRVYLIGQHILIGDGCNFLTLSTKTLEIVSRRNADMAVGKRDNSFKIIDSEIYGKYLTIETVRDAAWPERIRSFTVYLLEPESTNASFLNS